MNPFVEIAGRKIGYDYDPLVIAEIGINHSGSLEMGNALIAATAVTGGYELLAGNIKHFRIIKKLNLKAFKNK